MKKVEATFGSDFAIERAEERLSKNGYKFERKPPIKLVIYVRNNDDIEIIKKIISESHGYLEPQETMREKITGKIISLLSNLIRGGKKKD
ncbi:MAG TPA: hypothetical protein VKU94_06585 [Geobacterales bacterium]|nr:hypothetical protein [Geobacterales bacterium]